MPAPIPPERWAAVRAIAEGAPPTQQTIATVMGVHLTTVTKRYADENWQVLDFRRADIAAAYKELWDRLIGRFLTGAEPVAYDPAQEDQAVETALAAVDDVPAGELAARMVDLAARSAARILVRAEARGGVLSKGDADALSSIAKLSERMETVAGKHAAKQEEKSDNELATLLGRIDDRIVELARAFAERLVAGERAAELG